MVLHRSIMARIAVAACLLAGIAGMALAGDPQYLLEVDDMPLPVGFVEDSAAGMAFDKPEGRIVEAVARGTGSPRQVIAFYRDALPELGWQAVAGSDGLQWWREGEALRLDIAGSAAGVTVRFHLAPQ